MRTASIVRNTHETQISAEINLDGTGQYTINTGVGFLDHMLEQLSRHSLIDMTLQAKGDLHVDSHHLAEDSGIVVGQAVNAALGERRGITRYGSALIPMDEALVRVTLDLSNRPFLVWRVAFSQPKIGNIDTELFKEWFYAFAQNAGCTLHIECLYGDNNHHMVEACYKGLAKALRQASSEDARLNGTIPSTKGVLGGSL